MGTANVAFTPTITIDDPGRDVNFPDDVPTTIPADEEVAPPVAYLSWSDDKGHTWSSDYESSLGKVGEYNVRLIWRKLGYARGDRIFRLQISDPVPRVLLSAYVE